MLRLAARSVFLLLTVEYRYTASSPDNQTSPTDVGVNKTTVATFHPTFSTSVSPSGHTKALPAIPQGPQTTVNSTEPPTNQTLSPTSSKDILTLPPPTAPAVRTHMGVSSTNGTRTSPAPGEHSNTGASSTDGTRTTPGPGEHSNTGASSTSGTRPTITPPTTPAVRLNTGSSSTNGKGSTITPSTTLGEPSYTGTHSTNGTRTTAPPGENSTLPASSTNGMTRNATWSIIPTLPTNSSPIPGGTTTSTASSVPVTRPPCPTPSSINGTAPPLPLVPECTSSPSGVVSQFFVAIGLLAAVLTVFIVSTMVLCAKLSSRKYSLGGQRGTEMVCLSAMMTGHNGTGSRHANREGHRTLLTGPEDSDEDGGDTLTLNSFLPEGDRMV